MYTPPPPQLLMSNPHPKYKGALPSINEAPSQKESPHTRTRTCTCIHNRTRTHTRTRTRTQTCRGVARIKMGGEGSMIGAKVREANWRVREEDELYTLEVLKVPLGNF